MYELIIGLCLVILGYIFGRLAEHRHFKSLKIRELETMDFPMLMMKKLPSDITVSDSSLVSGSVVISLDYFKRVLASLRKIFGGRIISYETLLDRARREAVLRMKADAMSKNASMIYNVRLETCSISKSAKQNIGSVEVIAYGTAIVTA